MCEKPNDGIRCDSQRDSFTLQILYGLVICHAAGSSQTNYHHFIGSGFLAVGETTKLHKSTNRVKYLEAC